MAEKSDSEKQGKNVELSYTDAETTRETLPHDLVEDVLSRLPAIYLFPLRFMCKSWYELITRDLKFAKTVLDRSLQSKSNPSTIIAWGENPFYNTTTTNNRAYLDVYLATHHTECDKAIKLDLPFLSHEQSPSSCAVYGICNGMLCPSNSNKREIYIWNPLTDDHITIPYPSPSTKINGRHQHSEQDVFGFGFIESVNEYKIVSLVGEHDVRRQRYRTQLSVYTLGLDSDWRTLQRIPYAVSFESVPCPQINGNLYWLAKVDGELYDRAILSFNMREEMCYEISRLPIDPRFDMMCVQELGGLFSLITANYQEYVCIYSAIKLSAIKLSDGEEYCVTWQCAIGKPEIVGDFSVLVPLGVVADNGDIIVWKNSKGLITYNRIAKAINHLKEFGFPIVNAHAFAGSLISPRAISGAGNFGTY